MGFSAPRRLRGRKRRHGKAGEGNDPAEAQRRGGGIQAYATYRTDIFASLKHRRETLGMHENEIGTEILAAAIEVHREIGPGLLLGN